MVPDGLVWGNRKDKKSKKNPKSRNEKRVRWGVGGGVTALLYQQQGGRDRDRGRGGWVLGGWLSAGEEEGSGDHSPLFPAQALRTLGHRARTPTERTDGNRAGQRRRTKRREPYQEATQGQACAPHQVEHVALS